MGDASDYADVNRFMRSRAGRRCMEKFRNSCRGKRIVEVEYASHSTGVGLTLILEDGDYLDLYDTVAEFEIETLRDRYARVLDREYYKDFPERAPKGTPAGLPEGEGKPSP